MAGDYLSQRSPELRKYLVAGSTLVSAPLMALGIAGCSDFHSSILFLGLGLACSEVWRSNAAVLVRGSVEKESASTSVAIWLCCRNVLAGIGPAAVAALTPSIGLQRALLVAPGAYLLASVFFFLAEDEADKRRRLETAAAQEGPAPPAPPA